MSLVDQHPRVIVARVLLLEQLRKQDVSEILKITPNFVIQYEEVDLDNVATIKLEIDWEYALFKATMNELQKLFDTLIGKKESKIIAPEKPKIITNLNEVK